MVEVEYCVGLHACARTSTPWLAPILRALPEHVSRTRGASNLMAWDVLVRYPSSALPPTEPVRPKMPAYLHARNSQM